MKKKFLSSLIVLGVLTGVFLTSKNQVVYNKYSENIFIEEDCDMTEAEKLSRCYDLLPDELKGYVKDYDYYIVDCIDEQKGCSGRCYIDEKMIKLKECFVVSNFMHEVVHVYENDNPVDEEFVKIWKTEGVNLISAYYEGSDAEYLYSTPIEYYAEAANLVFWLKEDIKEIAPATYDYFNNLFNELGKINSND